MPRKRSLGNVHYDNRDRVAIVTGGSNGIGAAICIAFADSGGLVVSADIQEPHGHSPHAGIHFRKLDVSSESQCEEVVQWTKETFGGIDLLVNNAAIQPPSSYVRLDQVNDQEFQRMLGVNFCGYHFMAKHVARVLMEQQSGVIINIASGQGHRTARQVPVYGPLKAANLLQTMQWGVEYARYGIRVVSVSPGAINTPLVQASLQAQGGAARLANRHPLGRIGDPAEIAQAVLWLSSSHASFITATDLSVDGGLQAFGAFAEPYDPSTLPSAP